MRQISSPNFNDRKNNQAPVMLILHYTGTRSAEEAEEIYRTPNQVAPHYMIDKDGAVTQYVAEDKRAWHAGQSSFDGLQDINSSSIGIEIVNSGHVYDFEHFPSLQISKLMELIRSIRLRWSIPDCYILGHSDIAPGRKIDPGEKFPWDILHQNGIGLLPHFNDTNFQPETVDWSQKLKEFGYDYTDDFNILTHEFRRHYLRDEFDSQEPWRNAVEGVALLSLIKQKQNSFDKK
jgi:N-acetylmuramoyl-L-alanine amidase